MADSQVLALARLDIGFWSLITPNPHATHSTQYAAQPLPSVDCLSHVSALFSGYVVFWQTGPARPHGVVSELRRRLLARRLRPAGRGTGTAFRPRQQPVQRHGLFRGHRGFPAITRGQPPL